MAIIGKNVKIHLKDGSATGFRVVEIVNYTIQAIACSRLRLSQEQDDFTQIRKPGIYFLFGQGELTNKQKAYIGEAENIRMRLRDHLTNRDFWNEAIFFISKDEHLTKAHVKYLESRLIQMARNAGRYELENVNQSQGAVLPVADKDSMEEFLGLIKLLLGVMGHLLLDEPQHLTMPSRNQLERTLANMNESADNRPLSMLVAGLSAYALQTDEGILVRKGSQAALNTGSLSPGYKKLRDSLITTEVLKPEDGKYVFSEDIIFRSPSAAAAIIAGYNSNGLQSWRDSAGRTLSEIENS
ncbi:GIY-YIG nuclease family protein [Chitinophaga solisilvae]|uniref:GIY-YIG nuclease family protein n=1 Tax=Chitinophaga solisilvae TaxID=1233460 RepID=UPI001367B8DB|nr:GIY-YIG nuclease family protein [Chitinophaga solisilvae]